MIKTASMKIISNNTIKIMALAIVFGFLSGLLGYALVGLPFFGKINFSDVNLDRNIIIDQPRNVIVEQDLQLKQVENNLFPALINIYISKKAPNPLSAAYLPSEILGQGFVLTSDGWVVTANQVLSDPKIKYSAVGYQEKLYDFTNFIEDKATGVVFGKMTASGLPVASLGDSSQLTIGQTLILIYQRKNIVLAHIKKIGYDFKNRQDLILSSDNPDKEIFLDLPLDHAFNGGAVANFKGEIVGLVNNGRVIPVNYFKTVVNQILDKQKIVRPILGLNYIDLAQTEGLIGLRDRGALVYGNPLKASPAFEKLKDGDIIKKVDDVELNSNHGLADLLNNYKKGDKVEFLILRGGKEQTIEMVLN